MSICALGIAVHAIDLLPRWEPPDELRAIQSPTESSLGGEWIVEVEMDEAAYQRHGLRPGDLTDAEFRPVPSNVHLGGHCLGLNHVVVERPSPYVMFGRPSWLEWLHSADTYTYYGGRSFDEVEDGIWFTRLTRAPDKGK